MFRLYYVRWNTFGNIPAIRLDIQEDQDILVGQSDHQHYLLSLSSLLSKAERSSSPPPYDDPPPYHLAVQIWGAPAVIMSEPVTV